LQLTRISSPLPLHTHSALSVVGAFAQSHVWHPEGNGVHAYDALVPPSFVITRQKSFAALQLPASPHDTVSCASLLEDASTSPPATCPPHAIAPAKMKPRTTRKTTAKQRRRAAGICPSSAA
jgi:hypothetical protein